MIFLIGILCCVLQGFMECIKEITRPTIPSAPYVKGRNGKWYLYKYDANFEWTKELFEMSGFDIVVCTEPLFKIIGFSQGQVEPDNYLYNPYHDSPNNGADPWREHIKRMSKYL